MLREELLQPQLTVIAEGVEEFDDQFGEKFDDEEGDKGTTSFAVENDLAPELDLPDLRSLAFDFGKKQQKRHFKLRCQLFIQPKRKLQSIEEADEEDQRTSLLSCTQCGFACVAFCIYCKYCTYSCLCGVLYVL